MTNLEWIWTLASIIYRCKQSGKTILSLWFQKPGYNNQSMKKAQVCSCIAFFRKEKNEERNLKSENSQDYTQKPQLLCTYECTFMNSISGKIFVTFSVFHFYSLVVARYSSNLTSNKLCNSVNWKSRNNLTSRYIYRQINGNCQRINDFLWLGPDGKLVPNQIFVTVLAMVVRKLDWEWLGLYIQINLQHLFKVCLTELLSEKKFYSKALTRLTCRIFPFLYFVCHFLVSFLEFNLVGGGGGEGIWGRSGAMNGEMGKRTMGCSDFHHCDKMVNISSL
jgi:hypothetical protein